MSVIKKFHFRLALSFSTIVVVFIFLMAAIMSEPGGMFSGLLWILATIAAVVSAIVAFALGWLIGIFSMHARFQKSGGPDSEKPVFSKIGIFLASSIVISAFLLVSSSVYYSSIGSKIYNPNTSATEIDELARKFWVKRDRGLASNIARHKNILPETLGYLLQYENISVQAAVCGNKNLTKELFVHCAGMASPIVLAGLARNPAIPVNFLEALSTHEENYIRTAVASNPNASRDLLEKLSEDKNEYVRVQVAYNKNISRELLDKLASDKSGAVRMNVAKNTKTDATILARLVNDTSPQVKFGIINNKNTTPALLKILEQDKNSQVRRQATMKLERIEK